MLSTAFIGINSAKPRILSRENIVSNPIKKITVFLLLSAFIFCQRDFELTLSIGVVDLESGIIEILMDNDEPVNSFHIFISGMAIDSIYGGVAEEYEFQISMPSEQTFHIHGHNQNIEGDPIPVGNHVLTYLNFTPFDELICIYSSSCHGEGNSEFDVELGDCITLAELEIPDLFGNILNGYLDEYQAFDDTTGMGLISYVTIEDTEDLDFGDDIGLLSLNGGTNYGDCDSDLGEIIVGAAEYQGEPFSIPAYGVLDFCDDDGFQYPGFSMDDQIIVYVWDESDSLLYIMDIFGQERDEIFWDEGHVVLSFLSFGSIINNSGDLNEDGLLDILDIIISVDIIIGEITPSFTQEINADLNDDGFINVMDVVILTLLALNN